MKITERRLRSLIRHIIKEATGDYEDPSSSYNDSNYLTGTQKRQKRADAILNDRSRRSSYDSEYESAKDFFLYFGSEPDGNQKIQGLKQHLKSSDLHWNVDWDGPDGDDIPIDFFYETVNMLDQYLGLKDEFEQDDFIDSDGISDYIFKSFETSCSLDQNKSKWTLDVDKFVDQLVDPGV